MEKIKRNSALIGNYFGNRKNTNRVANSFKHMRTKSAQMVF